MIGKPKKPRRLSDYTRRLLAIVDQYKTESGDKLPDLYAVAQWAHAKGIMDLPDVDPLRVLARYLSRACQQDYVLDENREPVRVRHAVRTKVGDKQQTFWPSMEDIGPAPMRASLNSRSKGCEEDVLQIERDKRYYNKHHNPGDPINMDYDYNKTVEEHFMPTEYPEERPDDQPDES